jgi:hypothetical protein
LSEIYGLLPVLSEKPADLVEERGTVAVELVFSDPVDAQELLVADGEKGGHLGQGRIAENDVGGHVILFGQPLAQGAQLLEKTGIAGAGIVPACLAAVRLGGKAVFTRGSAMVILTSPFSRGDAEGVSLSTE